jgi:hypothetical protein
MRICDLSILSGMSRQWLNKLLDRSSIPGVQRKENGRLEIYDEERASEWASKQGRVKKKSARRQRPEKFDPWGHFIARGRSRNSREVRASIHLAFVPTQFGIHVERAWEDWSVPALAAEFKLSRQGIYQAIARLERDCPGIRQRLLFKRFASPALRHLGRKH